MCYGCYEDYGKPVIVNEVTTAAAAAIGLVYEYSSVGGNLHIVIDDWNLEDEHLDHCIRQISAGGWRGRDDPAELRAEQNCAEMLKTMSLDERASALAIHDDFLTG